MFPYFTNVVICFVLHVQSIDFTVRSFNCNDETEKNEGQCERLRTRYLTDETVSTCSSVKDQSTKFVSVNKTKLELKNATGMPSEANVNRRSRKLHSSTKSENYVRRFSSTSFILRIVASVCQRST